MFRRIIARIILVLALFLPSLVMAHTMSGRVLRVDNGNTVTIVDANNIQHTVRLQDIQAPGVGRPSGRLSQKNLQELIGGKHVTVEYDPKTGFAAPEGRVYMGGEDINLKQIEQGMAKFRSNGKGDEEIEREYAAAQEQAEREQRGVWYTPSIKPGEPSYERRMMVPGEPAENAQRSYPPVSERRRFVYSAAPAADPAEEAENVSRYVTQPKRARAPYGYWFSEPRMDTRTPLPGSQTTPPRPLPPAIVPMSPYWMHPPYPPHRIW